MSIESEPKSQNVLVPRKNGRIEVWKTTGETDHNGDVILRSQAKENHDGDMKFVQKSANPQFLTSEVQGYYADILGSDRNPTPEELDRHFEAQQDLGEQALSVVGVESPASTGKATSIDEFNNLKNSYRETAEVHDSIAVDALTDSIKDILAVAENGDMKNSDGKPYSRSEVVSILNDFVAELNNPSVAGFDITKLIPRSGGLRDLVKSAINYGGTAALKEAIANVSAQPLTRPEVVEQPASKVEMPAPETQRQVLERHLREYSNDLEDLYAELRSAVPKSDDYYRIEKQIRENKEDSGRVAAKLRQLK